MHGDFLTLKGIVFLSSLLHRKEQVLHNPKLFPFLNFEGLVLIFNGNRCRNKNSTTAVLFLFLNGEFSLIVENIVLLIC